MSYLLSDPVLMMRRPGAGERASARTMVLFAVFFLLGVALSAFWFYFASTRRSPSTPEATGGPPAIQLSDRTRAVLSRLGSPLEIRFYAVLDPATVGGSVVEFADRVRQLLSAYQQEAGDKIKLTSFDSASRVNPKTAAADGIQAFNLDKGDACYLGLTLTLNGRKETLPYLSPDWEKALESDLTRAISRLLDTPRATGAARPGASVPQAVVPPDTNAIQAVKALIPNLEAVSVEEGKRILREAAVKDFAAAAKEMEARVKEAEQSLSQLQTSGTDVEKQAAIKHLQQVRAEQAEKLRQIAAKSKAQIGALQQLKAPLH